jgi:hypothetical protein
MTNWRAVGIGLVVELFLGVVGLLLPGIGQFVAGLVGGFVAGYIASTRIRSGAWHGLLAGSLGGFLLALPVGVLVGVASIGIGLTDQLGSLIAGIGTTIFVVLVAVVLGANSALGGAIGSFVKDKYRSQRSGSVQSVSRNRSSRTIDDPAEPDRAVSTSEHEDSATSPKLTDSILNDSN